MRERFPRRNKKGTSTNIVPQIERATTIQTKRHPPESTVVLRTTSVGEAK
jgi:hypothetical protein